MRRLSWVLWPFRKMLAAFVWVLLLPREIVATPKMLWRGLIVIPNMLWVVMCRIWRFTLALPRNVWLGLRATPNLIWRGIRRLVHWLLVPPRLLWRGIVAVGRMIRKSPRKTYDSVRHSRDWILAKVEYLQSESA